MKLSEEMKILSRAILSLEMKRICYTCLFALVLVACSATRDARLLEAVTFSYGNYGPADVRQLLEDVIKH